MFGVRDVTWSVLICAVLMGFVQCRPAWSARKTVERDARDAFLEVYKGRRDLAGNVITPLGKGVHTDPMAAPISHRRFEITADRLSWSGTKAELVARHVVELVGEPGATVDVHVKLEKRGGRWTYTLFEVRDGPTIAELDIGNPWLQALRPPQPDDEDGASEDEDG